MLACLTEIMVECVIQMNLDFLDEYWNIVGSEQTQAIRQNKHFEPLTNVLLKNNSLGIPEE